MNLQRGKIKFFDAKRSSANGLNVDTFNIEEPQTVFYLSGNIKKGFQVFRDGSAITTGFTKTASNSITFAVEVIEGTEIIIIY